MSYCVSRYNYIPTCHGIVPCPVIYCVTITVYSQLKAQAQNNAQVPITFGSFAVEGNIQKMPNLTFHDQFEGHIFGLLVKTALLLTFFQDFRSRYDSGSIVDATVLYI
jgi:hypothetical protein